MKTLEELGYVKEIGNNGKILYIRKDKGELEAISIYKRDNKKSAQKGIVIKVKDNMFLDVEPVDITQDEIEAIAQVMGEME